MLEQTLAAEQVIGSSAEMITVFPTRSFRHQLRCAALQFMALFFTSAFIGVPDAHAQQSGTLEAQVRKVLDGDTFTLSGESRRIRVWGLDAPEWDQRGGSTATETLHSLISGQSLTCSVVDIDRYGRLVGQCFLPDGRDIAAEMIRSGAASEYCRYSRGYYGTC